MMVLIFFFKQKTAYEMRISDWSSDVCSSDLPAEPFVQRHDLARRADRFHRSVGQESQHRGVGDVDMGEGARVRGGARDDDARLRLAVAAVEDGVEIGSASCRERVCQYV